jgi:ADP-heptose:LPS heptosyltransferase
MPRENVLTTTAARLARAPFSLGRRGSFHSPHKLLAALGEAFPKARFDWLVGEWVRPALASNPRVTELVTIGEAELHGRSWRQIGQLIRQLTKEHYDTAFIPSRSALLSYIAWQAGIHQRVGLNIQGRGFAHTIAVTPPPETKNKGAQALLLAEAVGVEQGIIEGANMEFTPPDADRTAVTRRLVEEVDWLGEAPLVLMHPGGGVNPVRSNPLVRWPAERFAVLGNYLAQTFKARIVLVGTTGDRAVADAIAGMMAVKVTNYCGRLGLGALGALCEVADLYAGNDAGSSHIAAACGCQTLVIYGPTDPAYSAPYSRRGNVHTLWREWGELPADRLFTWDAGVTAAEAIEAADQILRQPADHARTMAILSGRPRENH